MQDNHKKGLINKIKLIRYLIPLIFTGVAAAVLIFKISTIEDIINVIKSMSHKLICLSVVAQICSYLGSGFLLKVIMNINHSRLTIFRGVLITMASASIGLAGGWVSSAAATYYWVAKSDKDSGAAVLTGVLPALYNTVVLVVVTIIGMVYLQLNHELSKQQIFVYGTILIIIATLIIVVIYIGIHREISKNLILDTKKIIKRILKVDYDFNLILNNIDRFYSGMELIGKSSWIKPIFGSFMNISFDMITLYILFIASGCLVKPSILIAGYSLAFLLGRTVFIVPGGVGIIEGGMAAVYTNLGIPNSVSVAAVLSYRLISFYIPSILGFVSMLYLKKSDIKNINNTYKINYL